MAIPQCPGSAELENFAFGRLNRDDLDRVAAHVSVCEECGSSVAAFDDDGDELLAGLREPLAEEDPTVPPELIAAARELRYETSADAWLPPEGKRRLGKYELREALGSGSFGHVFRAFDTELERFVAIKVLRAGSLASADDIDRFRREARSAARLKHPGIVLLYGTGQTDAGVLFLVEEYVRGATLADGLKAGRPLPRATAALVAKLADALDYAHSEGVIHRDVKPSNIMLDEEGTPHLMDFGLAKGESEQPLTPTGGLLGTPGYMSPEQARGELDDVDERSDVFSLGVILYEMLTGETPFRGNRQQLLLQLIEQDPPRPLRIDAVIPRDLETICLKAMAKTPSQRYQTAGELAQDLRRFLNGEAIHARRTPVVVRIAHWGLRNPIAASLLFAITLGACVGLWQMSRLSAELVHKAAQESAQMLSSVLEQANSHYASTVVERLRDRDVEVTHNYRTSPGSIPLPATFLTELGEQISAHESGMQVRHYSDFPFRSRQNGGPRDPFGEEALAALRRAPTEPFLRFEQLDGQPTLRYASARVMEPSCVGCHNNHPDSTKTDWEVGDVRGVLEIIRPLDGHAERMRRGMRGTYSMMTTIFVFLLVLSVLLLVAGDRRRRRELTRS